MQMGAIKSQANLPGKLPTELLFMIFCHLDRAEATCLGLTCEALYAIYKICTISPSSSANAFQLIRSNAPLDGPTLGNSWKFGREYSTAIIAVLKEVSSYTREMGGNQCEKGKPSRKHEKIYKKKLEEQKRKRQLEKQEWLQRYLERVKIRSTARGYELPKKCLEESRLRGREEMLS